MKLYILIFQIFFYDFGLINNTGEVDSEVKYIQGSPHYKLARKSLKLLEGSSSIEGVIDTEEYLKYEEYTVHESHNFGHKIHSADQYLTLIMMFYSTTLISKKIQ